MGLSPADSVIAWSLEAAFDAAWPGLKAIPAGDWLCKSAWSENGVGVSRRANSANPSGAHARLTEAAIERIEGVYARLGQPTYVRLPSMVEAAADRLLEARGYAAEGGTLTLIGPLAAEAPADVEIERLPTPEWLRAADRANGRGEAQGAVFSSVLERIDAPAAFAGMRRDDGLVSTAYAAVHGGWLCLEAVSTDPDWRGQGLAGQVVSSLMAWGAAHGARATGLQVSEDNAAARALYRRLGLERELYRYHYRKAP
jgi:ribosomal protein S18 acetylase RimI-like enzyme